MTATNPFADASVTPFWNFAAEGFAEIGSVVKTDPGAVHLRVASKQGLDEASFYSRDAIVKRDAL